MKFSVLSEGAGAGAATAAPLRQGTLGYFNALIAGPQGKSSASLVITLPVASELVIVALAHPDGDLTVRGFDSYGSEIAAVRRTQPGSRFSLLTLSSAGLAKLTIECARGNVGAHLVNYCSRERPPVTPRGVRMIARDGDVIVAETVIAGQPGTIVAGELAADRITSVRFEPAAIADPKTTPGGVDAVLVDLCWETVANGKANGWSQIPNYPYPMALPVAEPAYPCVGKPASPPAAEAMALSRVRYGPASVWSGARVAQLTSFLTQLVAGGPGGGAMNARTATFVDSLAAPDTPQLTGQNLLQLLQLAQLDPAMAQMLGLYWLDDQVVPGTAYDYLILADHGNAFNGQVSAALAAANGALAANVGGWVTFGHVAQPRAPLAAPGAPIAYVLPDIAVNGVVGTGRGAVGLKWILPSVGGYLMANAAVRYIAWRADQGDPTPMGAPTNFVPRNANAPFLAGSSANAQADAAAPASWPALTLNAVDRGLADGWYSYALSGIDIWGRHSAFGPPAQWRQTATAPSPLPWYYQTPAGDRQLHPFAVHILDKSPPSAPAAVEATALDPEDDFTYVRDANYVAWEVAAGGPWWTGLVDAERAAVLPLRVRWRWYPSQEQQNPATREFRIYFNPGSTPPDPDRFESSTWQDRIFVCAYGDHVTLVPSTDPDGPYRQYEVLLPVVAPPIGDPPFNGVALQPSLDAPIVYANISVSAADDKSHSDDNVKWAGTPWGGRFGNESRLAAPAKIYRVWRALPPAPPALLDDERVWATKADYHSQSFYSFRWPASPALEAHVYAVMDATLFMIERAHEDAATVSAADLAALATLWDPVPTDVVDGIGALRALKAAVSNGGTPGPDAAQRAQNDAAWTAACAALGDAALRGLAVLPLHEDSYVRQTAEPVDPTDAAGPDDPAGYVPNPQWRAWRATFDGRARNRYFLRAAYVDAAHNEGAMGPPSPPIYLPTAVPPRTPVITRVTGGDRSATIAWTTADAEVQGTYILYRTDDDYCLRDVRLMTAAVTIRASSLDPASAEATWTDYYLPGGRTWHYCLVFADANGDASAASRPVALFVPDEVPPDPPAWRPESWLIQDVVSGALAAWPVDGVVPAGFRPALQLGWTASTVRPTFVIARRDRRRPGWSLVTRGPGAAYATAQPQTFTYVDPEADASLALEYRIRVSNAAGLSSLEYAMRQVSGPNPPLGGG